MKKIRFICLLTIAVLFVTACGGKGGNSESATFADVKESYDVKGVTLNLKILPGGTFDMGTRSDGRMIKGTPTIHQVILDGYAISTAPVSQALWKAVMGSNPGSAESLDAPMDRVSWQDAQKFLAKLSKLTGVPFILPTEAMWEFALDEGAFTPVRNMHEWCSDRYSDEVPEELTFNPTGPEDGAGRIIRDETERSGLIPQTLMNALGFRVAVRTGQPYSEVVRKAIVDQNPDIEAPLQQNETFSVGDVKFEMIAVEGGSFKMGATAEQAQYGDDAEKPVTEMLVGDFAIGRTEVTAGLWQAVMGRLPLGNDAKQPNRPVINVSWYGAQMFIIKLNELTGRKFRLPTEAEWEYAARGGKRSYGYRFSGSNTVAAVAAYSQTVPDGKPVDVRKFQGNELSLYDMSGNAWEWVQDYNHTYGQPVEKSEWHVMRGGSAASPWNACRVSNRQSVPASNVKGTFGFRLAL